jgi:tetratricopeptide (TPR) repeat protein
LKDPVFRRDVDAQRSFSKLRTTTGNIYRFRQREAVKAGKTELASAMLEESILAYQQALELWEVNPEAAQGLLDIMTEQGKTAEALELIDKIFALDPFNNELFHFSQIAYLRDKLQVEIRKWESRRKEDPKDGTAVLKLLELYLQIQDTKAIGQVIEGAMKTHAGDRKVIQVAIATYLQSGQEAQALQLARRWEKDEPKNERVAYLVSRLVYLQDGNKAELQKAVRRALELGGEGMKEEYRRDQVFAPLRKGGALDALLEGPDSAAKAPFNGKTGPVQ